jgi:hypothetical protein
MDPKSRFKRHNYISIPHHPRAIDRPNQNHQDMSARQRAISEAAAGKLTSETSSTNTMVSLDVNGLSVEANATPDTEIAALSNYVIGYFGGTTGSVTAADVKSAR